MPQLSRRSMLVFALLGVQGLAACGGGGGGAEAASDRAGPAGTPPAPPAGGGTAPPVSSPPIASAPPAAAPPPAASPPAAASPPPPAAPPVAWEVGAGLAVFADGASAFDLNRTLPASVKRGGRFSVSAAGSRLPDGVALTAAGLLTAAAGTAIGSFANIVFEYDEP